MSDVRRVASVMGLRESAITEYERYHRDVWPEVMDAISAAGIRNYSIFRFGTFLFSYWEYQGECYDRDLAAIDEVPQVQEWNNLMATLQVAVEGAPSREWLPLREVFHLD